MKPQGYIKLHRTIEEWEWIDNPTMFYFWCRILLMANWEDKEWHGQIIERGSFITTLSRLSKVLHLSVQQVRTCLANMQSNKQITCSSTNKATKITIYKYDDYQGLQQAGQQTKNDEFNKPTTRTKEGSEYSDSNESSYSSQEERNLIYNNSSAPAPVHTHTREGHPPTPFHFRDELIALGVQPDVTDDWIQVRKTKKGVNTKTAFSAIKREIVKAEAAGHSANECIVFAVVKSWVGFKWEWMEKELSAEQKTPAQSRIQQYVKTTHDFKNLVNELFPDNIPGAGNCPTDNPDEQ